MDLSYQDSFDKDSNMTVVRDDDPTEAGPRTWYGDRICISKNSLLTMTCVFSEINLLVL